MRDIPKRPPPRGRLLSLSAATSFSSEIQLFFFLTVLTFLTVSPSNGQFGQSGHIFFCLALSALSALSPSKVQIVQIVQCIFFERCVRKLSVSGSCIFLVIS